MTAPGAIQAVSLINTRASDITLAALPSVTHRIKPMATDRVTTRDSPQRHHAAANNTVFRNRVACIHRATRLNRHAGPFIA